MAMTFCRGCGQQIHESAPACPNCGAPQMVTASAGSNAEVKYLLPVGRSGWAIAAGYLAFFAIFAIPAPLALLCGIMGLRDIKRHPEKLGKPRAIFGIVMGSIGCLILLAVIAN